MSVDNKSNCEDFQELLDAYFDKELGQEESRLVEDHLTRCSDCQGQWADLKNLMGHLASLPQPVCSRDFSELIEKRILAEAQADIARPAVKEGQLLHLRASRWLWLAAGLLLIGLCFTVAWQKPESQMAQAPSDVRETPVAPPVEKLQIASLPQERGKRALLAPGSKVPNLKRKPEIAVTLRRPVVPNESTAVSPTVAGVVALYDDELYEDGSNLGISTNEDGLYAIKL
jgi:hypothetical protein